METLQQEDATEPMRELMARMIRSRRDSGFVVFIVRQPVPTPLPMAGRPHGTRTAAEAAALEQLSRPGVQRAWTVGVDGIREVTSPYRVGDVVETKPQWTNQRSGADLRYEVLAVLSPAAVRVLVVGTDTVLEVASTMFAPVPR